eukprot:3597718-Prymnesium_polylepis.1
MDYSLRGFLRLQQGVLTPTRRLCFSLYPRTKRYVSGMRREQTALPPSRDVSVCRQTLPRKQRNRNERRYLRSCLASQGLRIYLSCGSRPLGSVTKARAVTRRDAESWFTTTSGRAVKD